MADTELGGQRTQALGRGEIADRCLLLRRELASTDAIPRSWGLAKLRRPPRYKRGTDTEVGDDATRREKL
jgi:hypothetical protein